MAKRKTKKKVPRRTDVKNATDRLRKALTKQTKAVLLDLVVDLASEDKTIMRTLEEQFDIEVPEETASEIRTVRQAVDEIEQAIAKKKGQEQT